MKSILLNSLLLMDQLQRQTMNDRASFMFSCQFSVSRLKEELDIAKAVGWLDKPSKNGKYQGWSAIAIHSMDGYSGLNGVDKHISESLADQCKLTDIGKKCPYLMEILDFFQAPKLRVRLLRLSPGGRIGKHTDRNYGWNRPILRLHIPVICPEGVVIEVADQQVIMGPGELWYIDTTKPHSVAHYGQSDRVHLVIDLVNIEAVRNQLLSHA